MCDLKLFCTFYRIIFSINNTKKFKQGKNRKMQGMEGKIIIFVKYDQNAIPR